MLKNVKIGPRLFVGFGVMIVLMVFLSGFSLYQIAKLSDLTTKLYDHPLTVSNAVSSEYEVFHGIRIDGA